MKLALKITLLLIISGVIALITSFTILGNIVANLVNLSVIFLGISITIYNISVVLSLQVLDNLKRIAGTNEGRVRDLNSIKEGFKAYHKKMNENIVGLLIIFTISLVLLFCKHDLNDVFVNEIIPYIQYGLKAIIIFLYSLILYIVYDMVKSVKALDDVYLSIV